MDGSGISSKQLIAIDPSDALELMIPKDPPGIVRVKGRVEELRPWPKTKPQLYFGTLKSLTTGTSIEFKCDINTAPALYEFAVLEGALVYDKKYGSKLCVLLKGTCLGSYIEREDIQSPLKPADTKIKKPFLKFLEGVNGDISQLMVVGTETGIHDVLSTLETNVAIATKAVKTTDIDAIIEAINSTACKAVVIVRGGDDETIYVWDDVERIQKLTALNKRIYTAIGHAHRLTMMDMYADQAFLSPSDFGRVAALSLREIEKSKLRDNKLNELIAFQSTGQQQINNLSTAVKRYRIILALNIIIFIVAIIYLYR